MKLTFYGGAAEVTGSATLLETENLKVLIDCGAWQGGRKQKLNNAKKLPFSAGKVQAAIVTHAHFDHCGRLPKLVAEGFRGPIFMTEATRDLVELILTDSLHVMETEYRNTGVLPFFNAEQLNQTLSLIKTINYKQTVKLNNGQAEFKLHNSGHILGSSFIEFKAEGKIVIFSGDLGNDGAPIISDIEAPTKADVVVMETTYATRSHEPAEARETKLLEALLYTAKHNGVLLIPAFAIERTEEIIWQLHKLADEHKLPNMPFYLDSPLALRVFDVFEKHQKDFDSESQAHLKKHDLLALPRLIKTLSVPESKAINEAPSPKVIIAGSGMMDGGRILHHLQRYLALPNTTVLVVGYQGENTLGRKISHGDKVVRINYRYVPVHARIIKVDAFSAHADHEKLVAWLQATGARENIFLNHGDIIQSKDFANFLRDQYHLRAVVPKHGESFTV